MRESIFNRELRKSLEHFGAFAYKIPDSPYDPTGSVISFTPKKPFDIVCCYKGIFIAIESKQIKSWKAFNVNSLADHQKFYLDAVVNSGGLAFVALNVRIAPRTNRLIFFKYRDLENLCSVHAKELQQMPSIGSKHGIFDLSEWLQEITC
jgi:penicillin-binding protein-related factor A (putative recombinase)